MCRIAAIAENMAMNVMARVFLRRWRFFMTRYSEPSAASQNHRDKGETDAEKREIFLKQLKG